MAVARRSGSERHRDDGRATNLYATDAGTALMAQAEKVASQLEHDRTRSPIARSAAH